MVNKLFLNSVDSEIHLIPSIHHFLILRFIQKISLRNNKDELDILLFSFSYTIYTFFYFLILRFLVTDNINRK